MIVENRKIELHDSVIESGQSTSDGMVLQFSHAYVHQSKGTPGVDSGSGWSYRATLTFLNGTIEPAQVRWPFEILDGKYTLNGSTFSNMVPVPFQENGDVEFKLQGMDADDQWVELKIRGAGVGLILEENPEYVEEFRGKDT